MVLVALVVPKIQVFQMDREILVHLEAQNFLVVLLNNMFFSEPTCNCAN